MKKLALVFLIILIFGVAGCVDIEEGKDQNPSEVDIYQALFNSNSKVTVYIDIENKELEKLQKDYEKYQAMSSKSPIYRKCNVTITINDDEYTIEEVGIRMKGNTSRRSFYSQEDGIYNLIHYKLSFSETFDSDEYGDEKKVWLSDEERELRKDRLFAGMEKIDLKWNKCYDATHIREIYAYKLYRYFNLVSANATLCNVLINNLDKVESLGVYTLYEPIDKLFIKRNFAFSKGDLYKVGWGKDSSGAGSGGTLLESTNHPNSIGKEDEDNLYFPIYDIKTNKKKTNHESLKNLITEINQGNFSSVDMEYFLKFMALSYLIGNPDDFRSHYNNYYIYFNDSLMVLIPYDYDRCLGVTKDWNPSNAMTGIDPNSLYTTDLGENVNPIIKKVLSDEVLKEKYNNYITEFSNDIMFSYDSFYIYYRTYYNNYHLLVKPTIEKVADQYIEFSLHESSSKTSTSENYSINLYFDDMKNIFQ